MYKICLNKKIYHRFNWGRFSRITAVIWKNLYYFAKLNKYWGINKIKKTLTFRNTATNVFFFQTLVSHRCFRLNKSLVLC